MSRGARYGTPVPGRSGRRYDARIPTVIPSEKTEGEVSIPRVARGERVRAGFVVARELGEGVYATVWLAEAADGGAVALKEVGVGKKGIPELSEMDVSSRFVHPALATRTDFFFAPPLSPRFERDGLSLFYVLELAVGTLTQRVRGPPHRALGDDEAMRLLYELSSAVAFLHRHGVYHCDLKPDNVLVYASGESRLSDLGLAQYASAPAVVCESLAYASPEAILALHAPPDSSTERRRREDALAPFRGERVDRAAVEMWALGCCFAFVLDGGVHAFGGRDHSVEEDIAEYATDPREYLRRLGVADPAMIALLARMLDVRVDSRLRTVEEVLARPVFSDRGYGKPLAGEVVRARAPDPTRVAEAGGLEDALDWVQDAASDELDLRAETVFLAIDLLYRVYGRVALPETGEADDGGGLLTATACLLIAFKLVEPGAPQIGALLRASGDGGFGREQLLAAERAIVTHQHGELYPGNLYTHAFSLWALAVALRLLFEPAEYVATDPLAWAVRLEFEEPPRQRAHRSTKDVSFAKLLRASDRFAEEEEEGEEEGEEQVEGSYAEEEGEEERGAEEEGIEYAEEEGTEEAEVE